MPRLLPDGAADPAALEERLRQGSTDLAACSGAPVPRDRLAACLVEGFRLGLAGDMEPGQLAADELERAAALAEAKYGHRDWTWGAAPEEGISLAAGG